MTDILYGLSVSAWNVWVSFAPSLTLGALIAGLLHIMLPPALIRRALSGRGGVMRAVMIGVPLPLCSCGVIPAGLGLHRDGASKGATVGFLISTPQTGVDSALVSASLLGLPFAIYKVVIAAVTGVIGGALTERLEPSKISSIAQEELKGDLSNDEVKRSDERPRGARVAFEHAESILSSIWGWLVVGVLLSVAIDYALPAEWFADVTVSGIGGGVILLTYLFALVISLPLYVCATASVPIAAMLVVKGMPIGVALIFLMAGPATNFATLGAIYRELGSRALSAYLMTLVLGSILFALILDVGLGWRAPADLHAHLHEHQHAWWEITLSVILGAWLLLQISLWCQERLSILKKRISPQRALQSGAKLIELEVSGLTCQGCARRLRGALSARDDVIECAVSDDLNQVSVRGSLSLDTLVNAVNEVGFTPHPAIDSPTSRVTSAE